MGVDETQRLGVVEIEATVGDAPPRRYELDLDPNRLTLRETVRLERVLGPGLGGLRDADAGDDIEVSMALVQALIWTKLCSLLDEPIDIDGFDIELGAVQPVAGPPPAEPPTPTAAELEAHLFDGAPDPTEAAVPKVSGTR